MKNPEVCVLKTDGINCDEEMANAFEVAGGNSSIVHINQLRDYDIKLTDYEILAIPGGFSYGDAVKSGKILQNELTSFLTDQLQEFVEQEKPIIGICNGFQVLVQTGLLPYGIITDPQMTLTDNKIGRFDCRWVDLKVNNSVSRYIDPKDFEELPLTMQTAHGEGQFFGDTRDINDLSDSDQIVFQYCNNELTLADGSFPENPNGAMLDIAGICDPNGIILGMMPHPERSVEAFHPDRSRNKAARSAANIIFKNIVNYAKEL